MDKISVEERLNDIISEKESHIYDLENQLDELKGALDYQKWGWCRHERIEGDTELYKDIPYPRLEMFMNRVSKNDWYEIEWVYGLVYSHFSDASYNTKLLFIPFSKTTSSGGKGTFESRMIDGKLETPFRDSLHIKTEANLLNLPAYISCIEKGIIQKLDTKVDKELIDRMIKK